VRCESEKEPVIMEPIKDAEEAESLLASLRSKYQLKETYADWPSPVSNRMLFYSVRSIDPLLDSVTDEDAIPFWAEIWDSAFGLALFARENTPVGNKVLELGCGVGLVGISIASSGTDVTQLDYSKEALEFCRLNAFSNGVGNIRQMVADIRHLHLGETYDVILGSDILYEPKLHPYILKVLEEHLRIDGRVLFADPGRKWASFFIDSAVPGGWTYSLDEVRVCMQNRTTNIDILVLTKRPHE
jgi:predicted nicotinamide N-methyase